MSPWGEAAHPARCLFIFGDACFFDFSAKRMNTPTPNKGFQKPYLVYVVFPKFTPSWMARWPQVVFLDHKTQQMGLHDR